MQAILQRTIQNGEEIDPPDVCPVNCRIVVKIDQESGFARVEDVLPAAKKNGKKPPKAARNDEDEGIDI